MFLPHHTSEAQFNEFGLPAAPRDQSKLLKGSKDGGAFDTASIAVPDSSLAQAVAEYAKEHLPRKTWNHSMRVFYYGIAILRLHFPNWKLSPETLYLTALLHDIGTTPVLRETFLSFEYSGGLRALELITAAGGHKAQAESVAETIIRHQDLGDVGNISQLTAIIHFATILDNVGRNPQLVTKGTIEEVVKRFPREEWTECFARTIEDEVERKPWCHSTAIDGFTDHVRGNTLMAPYDK